MNIFDAVLCMGLAAHLEGTDEAVAAAGRRALTKVKIKKDRRSIQKVIDSESPLRTIKRAIQVLG